jgi:hypothetical protein
MTTLRDFTLKKARGIWQHTRAVYKIVSSVAACTGESTRGCAQRRNLSTDTGRIEGVAGHTDSAGTVHKGLTVWIRCRRVWWSWQHTSAAYKIVSSVAACTVESTRGCAQRRNLSTDTGRIEGITGIAGSTGTVHRGLTVWIRCRRAWRSCQHTSAAYKIVSSVAACTEESTRGCAQRRNLSTDTGRIEGITGIAAVQVPFTVVWQFGSDVEEFDDPANTQEPLTRSYPP